MNDFEEPREERENRQGGGGEGQILPATAAIHEQTIKEFIPASWFHPVGIFKVLARIWDRLPDVGGKLFLTLTLDPKLFGGEESAFEHSRQWMRKVFYQLRQEPTPTAPCVYGWFGLYNNYRVCGAARPSAWFSSPLR